MAERKNKNLLERAKKLLTRIGLLMEGLEASLRSTTAKISLGSERVYHRHQQQNLAMPTSNILRVCVGSMLLVCFAFIHSLMAQDKPHAGAPQAYRIHIGDVLQISVYRHPELSRTVVVDGDGNHTLSENGVKFSGLTTVDALLRDMKMADLTVMDVANLVSKKLQTRAKNPQVTVIVVSMMISPLPPSTLPSPQYPIKGLELRDTPSPERLLDCCVVREGH